MNPWRNQLFLPILFWWTNYFGAEIITQKKKNCALSTWQRNVYFTPRCAGNILMTSIKVKRVRDRIKQSCVWSRNFLLLKENNLPKKKNVSDNKWLSLVPRLIIRYIASMKRRLCQELCLFLNMTKSKVRVHVKDCHEISYNSWEVPQYSGI